MITKTYFRCDPEKNTECKKRGCALVKQRGRKSGDCYVTEKAECAALNEAGKPIVAFSLIRGEDDGTD